MEDTKKRRQKPQTEDQTNTATRWIPGALRGPEFGRITKALLKVEMPKARILTMMLNESLALQVASILKQAGCDSFVITPSCESTFPDTVVKEAAKVKPDLLIVSPFDCIIPEEIIEEAKEGYRRIAREMGMEDLPPGIYQDEDNEKGEFLHTDPVGLEAVELLRKSYDTPVFYITAGETPDSDPEIWERIVKTHPVGTCDANADSIMLLESVKTALELGNIDKCYVNNIDNRENESIRKTAYLLYVCRLLQKEVDRRTQAEATVRTLFDSAEDAMFLKDGLRRYVMINPTMARLLDRPAAELIGKTDYELYDKETADHFSAIEHRVMKGESVEEQHSRIMNGVELTFLDWRDTR